MQQAMNETVRTESDVRGDDWRQHAAIGKR